MIPPLIYWLPALATLAIGIWLLRVRTPPVPPSDQPACGHCGYPTTGLAGNDCPECGHDLHSAGVLTPEQQRSRAVRRTKRRATGITLILAALLLLGPGGFVAWQFERAFEATYGPWIARLNQQSSAQHPVGGGPSSQPVSLTTRPR